MDRPSSKAGFLQCVACGSARMGLMGVEEDEGPPPSIAIGLECLDCDHITTIDISQATEQVLMGYFLRECPETCTKKAAHETL